MNSEQTASPVDLSNLLAPVVVLDTNIIRGASEQSTPFQILRDLAHAHSVKVVIPKVVLEERRTQWRSRYAKQIDTAKQSLSILSTELTLSNLESLTSALAALEEIDIEAMSLNRYKNFVEGNGFSIREMTIDECEAAWTGYFSGGAPFKKLKNRADIPDAHILASVVEIAKTAPTLHFVAGDAAMYDAASEIEGITCHKTLEGLIETGEIQALRFELETEKKWQKVKPLVSGATIKELVAAHVLEHGSELLEWLEVRDSAIPEDNHTALVQSYGEAYAVSVGDVQDWGAGYLRCSATYSVEALLSFMVFRGDAFDVPDWVSVSLGDFENDHYFEAEGYHELIIQVPVSVKINMDALTSDDGDEVYEVAIEESEADVTLAESG